MRHGSQIIEQATTILVILRQIKEQRLTKKLPLIFFYWFLQCNKSRVWKVTVIQNKLNLLFYLLLHFELIIYAWVERQTTLKLIIKETNQTKFDVVKSHKI